MRYLTLVEVLDLHRQIISQSTGTLGIRDLDLLKSAIAQPRMSFGGEDLYPTVIEKAIALGFSMIMNHPFVDGNKRTGHAALETFLILNGLEISASLNSEGQNSLEALEWLLVQNESNLRLDEWVHFHILTILLSVASHTADFSLRNLHLESRYRNRSIEQNSRFLYLSVLQVCETVHG